MIVDDDRNVLIGFTAVGPDVAELLHAATIAITGEVPLDRLWHAVPATRPSARSGSASSKPTDATGNHRAASPAASSVSLWAQSALPVQEGFDLGNLVGCSGPCQGAGVDIGLLHGLEARDRNRGSLPPKSERARPASADRPSLRRMSRTASSSRASQGRPAVDEVPHPQGSSVNAGHRQASASGPCTFRSTALERAGHGARWPVVLLGGDHGGGILQQIHVVLDRGAVSPAAKSSAWATSSVLDPYARILPASTSSFSTSRIARLSASESVPQWSW